MKHQTLSYIKSSIRILGYAIWPLFYFLPSHDVGATIFNILVLAPGLLIVSELIGILEERGC